jgi:hypothetical protein
MMSDAKKHFIVAGLTRKDARPGDVNYQVIGNGIGQAFEYELMIVRVALVAATV